MKIDFKLKIIFTLLCAINMQYSYSQDTIKYLGIVGNFQYESIELYPDSTFKWTREYDLSWSDFGFYKFDKNKLILSFKLEMNDPLTMKLKDTLKMISGTIYTKHYKLVNDELFLLNINANDRKVNWIRDSFFRTKWDWITFGYHRLKYIRIKKQLQPIE